jgi:hypothetical protein
MNKNTMMLIAALTLGGATAANAATPTAKPAKPAKVHVVKKAPAHKMVAAKPKPTKQS